MLDFFLTIQSIINKLTWTVQFCTKNECYRVEVRGIVVIAVKYKKKCYNIHHQSSLLVFNRLIRSASAHCYLLFAVGTSRQNEVSSWTRANPNPNVATTRIGEGKTWRNMLRIQRTFGAHGSWLTIAVRSGSAAAAPAIEKLAVRFWRVPSLQLTSGFRQQLRFKDEQAGGTALCRLELRSAVSISDGLASDWLRKLVHRNRKKKFRLRHGAVGSSAVELKVSKKRTERKGSGQS